MTSARIRNHRRRVVEMTATTGTGPANSAIRSPRLVWLFALLIAVVALWNCRSVLAFEFVARDDDINIYYNPHLGPPSAPGLTWMFTDPTYMRRYVPIGWLTFSVVYYFSGLSPVGYHAANLVLHVSNTLLLYILLGMLCRRFGHKTEPGWRALAAAAGAAFWALHPLRAETIGWSSGLLYGAAGFWALGSLLAYLRLQGSGPAGRLRMLWLVLASLCYTMSILTYPIGIMLVAAFVLIDVARPLHREAPERPPWRRLVIEKLAFIVPGAAILIVTLLARFEASAFWPRPPTAEEFSWVQRAAQAFGVWVHYVGATAWPDALTPGPTWLFKVNPFDPVFVGSALSVVGVTLLATQIRSGRKCLWLWLAYLGLLAPFLGFTEHPHFASDRYSYLSCLPISVAVAGGLLPIQGFARAVAIVVVVIWLAGLAVLQRAQLRTWESTDTVLARTIERSRDHDYSLHNYSLWMSYHANAGRREEARDVLRKAERFAPDDPRVLMMARELTSRGGSATGRGEDITLPPAAKLHAKLAQDFSRTGRVMEAQEHFAAARRLAPDSATLAYNWAVWCAVTGEPVRSLNLYHHAIGATAPDRPAPTARVKLLLLISDAFAARGEPTPALRAAEAALRLARVVPESGLADSIEAQVERIRGDTRLRTSARRLP